MRTKFLSLVISYDMLTLNLRDYEVIAKACMEPIPSFKSNLSLVISLTFELHGAKESYVRYRIQKTVWYVIK